MTAMQMRSVLTEAFDAPVSEPDWQRQLLKALGSSNPATAEPQQIVFEGGSFGARLFVERPVLGLSFP